MAALWIHRSWPHSAIADRRPARAADWQCAASPSSAGGPAVKSNEREEAACSRDAVPEPRKGKRRARGSALAHKKRIAWSGHLSRSPAKIQLAFLLVCSGFWSRSYGAVIVTWSNDPVTTAD